MATLNAAHRMLAALVTLVALCLIVNQAAAAEPAKAGPEASARPTLLFFWGVGCPHCEEARPLVEALANENPRLRVEAVEVRRDPEGRRRFLDTMQSLQATAFFELVGLSQVVTRILGVALLGMGSVNLEDVVWFEKGPSLVIPQKAKPGLYRRMRGIARAATTPAALAGISALAFLVNLIELGCTLGLPAMYTRVLSLRGLGPAARIAYLALYNVLYVVPLVCIVAAFIGLKRRIVMTERAARVLKGVSGLLLFGFGAVFLVAPDLLAGG